MSVVFTMERSGRNYSVMRNKKCVYGPVTTIFDAQTAMDRLVRTEKHKLRNCMTCGNQFMSEGVHHRMCAKCRSGASAIFDGAV